MSWINEIKKRLIANTNKTGSGSWYFPLVDSDGHLQVDNLAALPAGSNVIGKIRTVTATGDEITDDTEDALKVRQGKAYNGKLSISITSSTSGTVAIPKDMILKLVHIIAPDLTTDTTYDFKIKTETDNYVIYSKTGISDNGSVNLDFDKTEAASLVMANDVFEVSYATSQSATFTLDVYGILA